MSRAQDRTSEPVSPPCAGGTVEGSVFGGFEILWRQAARGMAEDVLRRALPSLVAEMRAMLAEETGEKGGATYVTVKAAAEMMDAHPATVRRLIAAGKLGKYSVESQARVKVSDIHAYMAREGCSSPTVDLEARALAIVRNE